MKPVDLLTPAVSGVRHARPLDRLSYAAAMKQPTESVMESGHHEAMAYHEAAMRRVATTPAPFWQKFKPGARVRIADDLGPAMRHFPAGRLATVNHTYAHAFGGDDVHSYSLDVDEIGDVAWYHESQLTQA